MPKHATRKYKTGLAGLAHELRMRPTYGENRLWWKLRQTRALHKLKFRRQQPIGPYIADFCCISKKLVIEIDGPSHDNTTLQDKKRETYMINEGFRVMRFSERQVLENCEGIIEAIVRAVCLSPHP